jgi:cystathionine beta-synthase
MRIQSVLNAIGNTPLVKVALHEPAMLLAKLEYLNPGGSVKDRSALYMIEEAEQRGALQPGYTIIDASSGNQGIAAAMIGAIKGYKVIITVSEKISAEKKTTLKALGAQLVICPSTPTLDDPENYYQQAVRLHKNTPNSFMPNQYFNKLNAQAHYALLGPEIWEQTEGKVTHFVAGTGTCGTITGVGRYLKEMNPAIQIIGVDSVNSFYSTKGNPLPYKVEGIGIDWDSPILDRSVVDHIEPVRDEDAIAMLKSLARDHGLLVGPSSGAVAHVAREWGKKLNPTDLLVMIFGDSGRAYLTKGFYD